MPIKTIELPNAKELHSLFEYDPSTGSLIWKMRYPLTHRNNLHNSRDAGKEVGATDSSGHRQVRVNRQLRAVHRVIWKMMTGKDPKEQIDHINGVRNDNRWENLREATALQNAWNNGGNPTNKSGHPGVFPMKTKRATSKKWRVTFNTKGKRLFVGDFYTKEEAIAAYNKTLAEHRDVNFKR